MSLILDALRKLELERKAKRQGGIDLRPDVLSYRGTPLKSANSRRLLLVAVALLLITGGGAFIYLRSGKTPPVTMTAPPEPVRSAVPELQPVLPAPAPPLQPSPATIKADNNSPAAPASPVIQEQALPTEGTGADNITVSGIAWQDERRLRRAVVNGSLVAEGAEVLGARILEIKETRVRFSRNGQVFEVLYPSSKAGDAVPQ